MPDKKVAGLPDHLVLLLDPTPSGAAKLVAAWDGLTTESQILILNALETAGLPAYLNERVFTKALDSPTAYIRYLAAKRLTFGSDDTEEKKTVKKRIEDDPDPLVRYCLFEESRWRGLGRALANAGAISASDLADADAFFALPQEARLAKVRSSYGSGTEIANLIEYAVDHQLKVGKVSAIDLFEILSDYVNRTEFKTRYGSDNDSYDGFTEYGRGKDVDALWCLVLKVPEYISDVLIKNLPPGAGLSSGIPENVLSGMSDDQLTTLFNREDIDLKELRKKTFFAAGEKRDEVKDAAIRYNFDLDYGDFVAILTTPKTKRKILLGDLAWARDLSLCLYAAIIDLSLETDTVSELDAEFAVKSIKRRLGELKGWHREVQLKELRLYRVAKAAVPWRRGKTGNLPSGELEFLSQAVVEGNTWGTFMAFSKAWAEESWRTKPLEKLLPRIGQAGDDELGYDSQVDDKDAAESIDLVDQLEERLRETVSTLTEQAEDKQMELKDSLRELTTDVARLQATQDRQSLLLEETLTDKVSATKRETEETQTELEDNLDKLTADVTRLHATQNRQTLLLYVAIGLLVWLLIKIL